MSSALRIQMLDVPLTAVVGESIELTCSYDLEGDKLYSVKWYKNDAEVTYNIIILRIRRRRRREKKFTF